MFISIQIKIVNLQLTAVHDCITLAHSKAVKTQC